MKNIWLKILIFIFIMSSIVFTIKLVDSWDTFSKLMSVHDTIYPEVEKLVLYNDMIEESLNMDKEIFSKTERIPENYYELYRLGQDISILYSKYIFINSIDRYKMFRYIQEKMFDYFLISSILLWFSIVFYMISFYLYNILLKIDHERNI